MADTPPIRKFLFDKSFDDATMVHRSSTPEKKPLTLKHEQLEAIKKEAWDAGFAAGSKTQGDEQAQRLTGIFTQIEKRLIHLMENMQTAFKTQEGRVRQAILAIAKKLLPEFTTRNGLQEIESMLTAAIGDMLHEPRLVVRIHEAEFDTINARIHEITVQKAYAGKVVVLADAAIAAGDCRIEWADGGIERNSSATWQDIEKAVMPDKNTNITTPSQE